MLAVIAAAAIAFAFTFGGTDRLSDPGLPGERESVFATIQSDTDPVGAEMSGVRLASLETDVTEDTEAADDAEPTAPVAATLTFAERFAGERVASFDERFGAPRRMPTAEIARDSPAPLETPKRQNVRLAMLAPPADPAPITRASIGAAPSKAMPPADARSDEIWASLGSRTAIYDISAQVVYLPNGEKLEAHSGFGSHMDDPRSVRIRRLGVTPPNVYELSLRERLFHGVRAIRLNPVDRDKMFGRDGMLAHSYLLGPSGQSNGCVSIGDYPKFLNAYLNGEIERLVVVERLADAPSPKFGVGWLSERLKALFKSS